MAQYQLEVLNDKEFEELCKDLLEKETDFKFQIFKSGRDKGIDLRYAENTENKIIVQAKRFGRSTFSNLTAELRQEYIKIGKLIKKPSRYIFMTAFDPSVDQVDKIVKQMSPWIKTSQDVYGRDRIMNLIQKYPEIEKKYYKLWLTSSNILNQILHNAVHGRSEFVKEKILRKASFYVPTKNFDTAVSNLKEHHFLIISGEPGIGKTTISYLLICDLLANGYQLIYVDDQLKDAEDILSRSPKGKHVIFFDDFFGANLSEIMIPRNSESKIVSFIERIKASSNNYMVMTTRTTILRQAQFRFEKFNRSGFADLSKYELEIKSYTKLDKAKILYNHLFHSGMAPEQYDIFFKSQNYLKIINHPNYFPRLIEFITLKERLKKIPTEDTENFIFNSLRNPKEIWHFAFDQQLTHEDQFLLMSLFSLGSYKVDAENLEKAFEQRYAYEIRENGFVLTTDAYQRSLKKLLDGFIKSERDSDTNRLSFGFLNPSIGDFVINYLRERSQECKRILYSAAYFSQITNYFAPGETNLITLSITQLKDFYPQFNNRLPELLANASDNEAGQITHLYILMYFFPDDVDEARPLSILEEIAENLPYSNVNYRELYYVLSRLDEYDSTRSFIKENWGNFFQAAINVSTDSSDISSVLACMEYYELYTEDWKINDNFVAILKDRVNTIYSPDDIDLSSKQESIFEAYYDGYHDEARGMITEKVSDDYADFLNDCNLSDFYDDFYRDVDADVIGLLNSFIGRYNDNDDYDLSDRISTSTSVIDDDTAIKRLFER